MDRNRDDLYGWVDYMEGDYLLDPYFPGDQPEPLHDHHDENPENEQEEDPEEEQEEDPEEEQEEDPEEVQEEDMEEDFDDFDAVEFGISDEDEEEEDDEEEEPEECITDDEDSTPQPAPYHPSGGKCLSMLRDIRRNAMASHYEVGGPSQAPPEDMDIFPSPARLNRAIERVGRLEEEERVDASLIQTLYHRIGESRREAMVLSAQVQVLQQRQQITERRLDTAEQRIREAEQERDNIREEHDRVVSFLNAQ